MINCHSVKGVLVLRRADSFNSYSCPECRGQLKFIAQYNRWWCPRCKRYPYYKKKGFVGHGYRYTHDVPEHVCQVCGSGLAYVQQYSRWWCGGCQRYTQPVHDTNIGPIEHRRVRSRTKPARVRGKHGERLSMRKHGFTGIKKRDDFKTDRLVSSQHEDGSLGHSVYRVRGDRVFAQGSGVPMYRIRGDRLYRTSYHPAGAGGAPVFRLDRDSARLRPMGGTTGASPRFTTEHDSRTKHSKSGSGFREYKGYKGYSGFKSKIKRPSIHDNDD